MLQECMSDKKRRKSSLVEQQSEQNKQLRNLQLTTITKLSEYSDALLLLFCLPVTISSSNIPKLYTSAFSVN
jgi:hypothetical protein